MNRSHPAMDVDSEWPPLPEEMVYVEIAAFADKLTKSMLALLSRKFFAKLGDEILTIESLLIESAQGGHSGLIRMIFDGYSPSRNHEAVSNRFISNARAIILPFVVEGNLSFVEYLRPLFPKFSLVQLRPEFNIGSKGNFAILEYLEKSVLEGETISWQLAFEGACCGKQVNCAKKSFLKWKDQVEEKDSMEAHLIFVNSSVTSAAGSCSLELLKFVRSNMLEAHWERALKENKAVLVRALQAGDVEVIDELLKEEEFIILPSSCYEYAPNKAVVHFLHEKGFPIPKDPWYYQAVSLDDLPTVDALFHLGALFTLRQDDIKSSEMLTWCLENLGHAAVPIKKVVFNLMCQAAEKDHINMLKKCYAALFYSEEKFGPYEIEVISDKAARNGSLEVYKWLFQEKLLTGASGFHINVAVTYGRFQMVKFAVEKAAYYQRDLPNMCANYGKMKILKWAVKSGFARKTWAQKYIAERPVGDKSYNGYYNPNLVKVLNLLRTMLENNQLTD